MKNEDIHNSLPKKEVRDFLGQLTHKEGLLGSEFEIRYLEKELEKIKERLIHCRKHRAVVTLIESNGWKEFDVSDDVPYSKDSYFPFIGTEEEFEVLKKKLEKEK